ncbi:hypothetical protein FOL47_003918 [Perkinsus chesapeaki]|uniref:Uncharacterized protein n=1 Tax=Perkinsus chesapeaki TaxID=330153 RepID=A0A7J6M5B7_PERCH|nr:hypothetical protein FOL47_003918 [Perkinsus chesapeaki]
MAGLPKKIDPARLHTFFARCSVVANLLQSRLAMPIMYPLNPQLGQLKDRNPIAVSRFSQEQVAQTLSHVAPAVVGLTHMARVLKAGHALEYYATSGGRRRFRRREKSLPKDKSFKVDFASNGRATINVMGMSAGADYTVDGDAIEFSNYDPMLAKLMNQFGINSIDATIVSPDSVHIKIGFLVNTTITKC